MAKKKSLLIKKKEIENLLDKKTQLLQDLVSIEDSYNSLAQEIKSAEEWLYGLPIESLTSLGVKENRRTRLGDVRIRAQLRKNSIKTLDEIDKINSLIKNAEIDYLVSKIDVVLKTRINVF